MTTVIGMALFWQVLRFSNVTTLFPTGSVSLFFFVIALATVAAATVLKPQSMEQFLLRNPSGCIIIACAIATSALIALQCLALYASWWDVDSPTACLIAFGAGMGNAVIMLAWYTRLALTGVSDDWILMAQLFGSMVLSFFLGLVMFSLSPFPEAFTILVPILAGLCYKLGDNSAGSSASFPLEPHSRPSVPVGTLAPLSYFGVPPSGTLLILLVLIGLLGDTILVCTPQDDLPEFTLWLKYLLSIVVVAAAFIALYRSRNERKTAFAIGLTLAVALVSGMVLLGLQIGAIKAVGVAVVTSCRTCVEVLVVFLLVRDSFDCRVAYWNFSILYIGPVVVSCVLGGWIVPFFFSLIGVMATSGTAMLAIALSAISVIALVIVLGILVIRSFDLEPVPDWNEEDDLATEYQELNNSTLSTFERRLISEDAATHASITGLASISDETLGQISRERGLTARETQILVYAFRGYSLQRIAELDVISLNTVKSHWKNLYRKLEVHTRQELIDFIEARL